MQGFKSPLRPAILKGCKFVQKPEVNDALTYFDILNEEDLAQLREDDQEDMAPNALKQVSTLKAFHAHTYISLAGIATHFHTCIPN